MALGLILELRSNGIERKWIYPFVYSFKDMSLNKASINPLSLHFLEDYQPKNGINYSPKAIPKVTCLVGCTKQLYRISFETKNPGIPGVDRQDSYTWVYKHKIEAGHINESTCSKSIKEEMDNGCIVSNSVDMNLLHKTLKKRADL